MVRSRAGCATAGRAPTSLGFSSSLATYPIGGARGTKLYIGLVAFLVSIVVVGVGSAATAYVRRAAEEDREAAAA